MKAKTMGYDLESWTDNVKAGQWDMNKAVYLERKKAVEMAFSMAL